RAIIGRFRRTLSETDGGGGRTLLEKERTLGETDAQLSKSGARSLRCLMWAAQRRAFHPGVLRFDRRRARRGAADGFPLARPRTARPGCGCRSRCASIALRDR